MWRSRGRCVIKPAYSVSFLLSINTFVWQNVLYFLDVPRMNIFERQTPLLPLYTFSFSSSWHCFTQLIQLTRYLPENWHSRLTTPKNNDAVRVCACCLVMKEQTLLPTSWQAFYCTPVHSSFPTSLMRKEPN